MAVAPSGEYQSSLYLSLFGFAKSATYHRHWTSRLFLLNNVQRSPTSLLLGVILAHTLAKLSDDAGSFIRRSLVSASHLIFTNNKLSPYRIRMHKC